MDNNEKLQRILTKDFIEENIKEGIQVSSINVFPLLIKNGIDSVTEVKNKFEIIYKLIANEGDGSKHNIIKLKSHLNLRALEDVDSKTEEDILSNIISNEIRFIEKRAKEEINQIKELDRLREAVKNKVHKQLNKKVEPIQPSNFYIGDNTGVRITNKGIKYMNNPLKPEVLVTPDEVSVTPDDINIEAETVQITTREYIELKKFKEEYNRLVDELHPHMRKGCKENVATVENDESKSSIENKGKRIICKVEKKPIKQINLGNLTLQEKDGKLAVTDKNGSTRFI